MRARTAFVPVVIVAALALAGCTSTPSTSATTAAPTGPVPGTASPTADSQATTPADQLAQIDEDGRVTGSGFAFTAPKGWRGEGSPDGTEVLLRPTDAPTEGTAIAVTIGSYTESLESYEDEVVADGAGRGMVATVEKRVSLDGVEAAHLRLSLGDGPSAKTFDQLFALTSGKSFRIVFSSAALTEEQHQAILDQIIDTWTWA